MEYFFYCRDKPQQGTTRRELLPDHWAFMDRYKDAMIARGPTMSDDGSTVTGSMHIADLPDEAAAQVFAFDEPLANAGLFDSIEYGLWRNVLGRTMWQFAGTDAQSRFLFIGLGNDDTPAPKPDVQSAYTDFWSAADTVGRCILFGPLLDDDGVTWIGSAVLLEAPDVASASALVNADPLAQAKFYQRQDLYPWRFGGAENLQDLVADA